MPIKTASNAAARKMFNTGAAEINNPRVNKFGAMPVKTVEVKADSGIEYEWLIDLKTLEQGGYIRDLVTEKNGLLYALDVNGYRICQYEADAKFTAVKEFHLPTLDGILITKPGREYVIDAKSKPTRTKQAYVHKRNLMWALFKIKIIEVGR